MDSSFKYKWKIKLKYDKEQEDAEKRKKENLLGLSGGGKKGGSEEMNAVEKEREALKKRSIDFLK